MKETFMNLKSFFFKSKRVWHVLKKPTKDEFISVAKISAIGILIIGVLGFAISIAVNLFI
ncbi:protein translocase SEC61 complex subunit gamma [Candidatus Pacearchaeota archaeon CG10_big_fil_rev_8_21_14_0_10_34_12]|nr:MAG: protein translocase SEC61 complex subunit gamma [Candidatus Pacearchaeota archaeon CG10_big_fil_rev_8_21_14_0_10_34_12]